MKVVKKVNNIFKNEREKNMEYIVKFAEGFIHLFKTGANTFIDWMGSIVPLVLMLLIAMNTIIQLIGEEKLIKLHKNHQIIHL